MVPCAPTHGAPTPPLPNSPEGPAPHPIPRLNSGWVPTPATRPGSKATAASGRCSTPSPQIPRVNWEPPPGRGSATPCRSSPRCSQPRSRCHCRRIPVPSRQWRASPARIASTSRYRRPSGTTATGATSPSCWSPSVPSRHWRDSVRSHAASSCCARSRWRTWTPSSTCWPARPTPTAARPVHDLDHRTASRPRRAGAAGAGRRRHLSAFRRNGIRQGGEDRAAAG